ncbi:MAG TPA: c-type cytochrome [Myxococcota bacterium]
MRREAATAALFAVVGLGLVLASAGPGAARDDAPAEIAAKSNPVGALTEKEVRYFERQFRAKCARCHGADGRGGGEEAAAQAVPPANFTDAAYMRSRSDGQLFYQILMGGGARSAMPAFGPGSAQAWDEDKIWRMVAFVRRFAQEKAD